MSNPHNDDIERSFERLNRPQEYLEATQGLGATRPGRHARDTYWPQLAEEIHDSRAKSRDKVLLRTLKGLSDNDLAKDLLAIGMNVGASDRLGADRKTGNKTYRDTAEVIGNNLVPHCRERKLRIKVGDWGIERLRKLPIFSLLSDLGPMAEGLSRWQETNGFDANPDTLVLTAEFGDVLGDFMVEQIIKKPLLSPMFEPPLPWTQVNKGGVPGYSISLCSGHHPKTEAAWRHAIAHGKMRRVLDALNYIQSIPYVINEPVLAFMRSERRRPVQRPDRKDMWKVLQRGPVQDQWKKYLAEMAREVELELAMYICKRGRFWTPMRLDFRGRVVAIPHFHFGREDRIRGLFLFADPQPIGVEGLKWLKGHVARVADGNTWSRVKKPSQLSREQRVAWTDENLPMLRKIGETVLRGDDPQTIEWALPSEDDDERYQFIAACAELVQALDQGPTFETRLPLIFDCTNSGLQHLSAMRRDPIESRMVNITKPLERGPVTLSDDDVGITDDDGRKDFYGIMSVALWKKLYDESKSSGESRALFDLLDGPLDRKITKTPVMSYFYGATIIGMSDQIADVIGERNKERRHNSPISIRHDVFSTYEANGITYGKFVDTFLPYKLAEILYELLERRAPHAAETRNHFIKLAELCNEHQKVLRFDTPLLELPVISRYFEAKTERLICSGVRRRRRDIIVAVGETDKIEKDRAEDAIAANAVHAADAALLHLIALACSEKSMPLLPIHDCFATSAPFAAELNDIARDCFARLHDHKWLDTIWEAARKILPKEVILPPQLELGDLDLNEVKSNDDFIN
jgi:DNA-directed RNA polymerase